MTISFLQRCHLEYVASKQPELRTALDAFRKRVLIFDTTPEHNTSMLPRLHK